MVFGIIGAGAAYFTNFQGFKDWVNQQIDELKGNNGNGQQPQGPDCTANPTDPACTGNNGNGNGDCSTFGGDCNNACAHGCQGSNCVACLSACGKSCSDTNDDASCQYTCDNGFCTSWRDKGCTNSCSKCNKNAPSYAPTDSPLYTFGDIPISVTTY